MNISRILLSNSTMISEKSSFLKKLKAIAAAHSEHFWSCIAFVLFLLMGPFSAIAVVIGLWNLTNSEYTSRMTEPATQC